MTALRNLLAEEQTEKVAPSVGPSTSLRLSVISGFNQDQAGGLMTLFSAIHASKLEQHFGHFDGDCQHLIQFLALKLTINIRRLRLLY